MFHLTSKRSLKVPPLRNRVRDWGKKSKIKNQNGKLQSKNQKGKKQNWESTSQLVESLKPSEIQEKTEGSLLIVNSE